MSHILPLLNEMRGRLGMYLGATSLTKLAAFLRGYDYAVEHIGRGNPDWFLPDFRDWVHRRFQATSHSWEETILLHSNSEADAVKQFWELLDEFLKENPTRANGSGSEGDGIPISGKGLPQISHPLSKETDAS
jgi:hypothetical protein